MSTKLEDVVVGAGLPLGIKGTAADITDLAGATIVGRLSLNGAAASEVAGSLFVVPDEHGFIGLVPFPGTLITAAGRIDGVVIITKPSQSWSPLEKVFHAKVAAHV